MALERVDSYMQDLSIGKGGIGFLAELNGNLIATSTLEVLFEIGDQGAKRLHLSEDPNPVYEKCPAGIGFTKDDIVKLSTYLWDGVPQDS